jgi:type II secretory pathway pseudopilin PulG
MKRIPDTGQNEDHLQDTDPQGGWSMVELIIAMTLLTIGVISFVVAITSSLRLASASHQKDIAMNAARHVIEQMRMYTVKGVFNTFSANPDFDVADLILLSSDTDGKAGEVIFPADSGNLVEDQTSELMGTAEDLDLDGDGTNNGTVVPDDCLLLPVVVRVEWQNAGVDWIIEIKTLLTER